MATKINRNQLDYRTLFTLAEWLKFNQDKLHRLSRQEIADRAKKELGLDELTPVNVTAAIKASGAKIVFAHARAPRGGLPKDRVRAIAAELIAFIEKLGETPSERLLKIANRKG